MDGASITFVSQRMRVRRQGLQGALFPLEARLDGRTTGKAEEGQGEIDPIEIWARALCAAGPMHREIRVDLGLRPLKTDRLLASSTRLAAMKRKQ